MMAVVFAALGALSFSINSIFTRRAVTSVLDAATGVLITVPLSVVFFLLILIAIGQVGSIASFSWQSYGWLSAAGIVNFMVGRSLNYKLVQMVGANVATIVRRTHPIVAVILGIMVLGEPLSWQLVVGVLLIICGLVVTMLNPQMFRSGQGLFSSIPRKAYFLGLGIGLAWGVNPILIKFGLGDSGSPIAGVFVSYTAAAIVAGSLLCSSNKRADLAGVQRGALGFFGLAGLFSAVAGLLHYIALSLGRASVVAPIFLLFFSYLFNRKLEVFGVNVILGVIAVVAGSILLI